MCRRIRQRHRCITRSTRRRTVRDRRRPSHPLTPMTPGWTPRDARRPTRRASPAAIRYDAGGRVVMGSATPAGNPSGVHSHRGDRLLATTRRPARLPGGGDRTRPAWRFRAGPPATQPASLQRLWRDDRPRHQSGVDGLPLYQETFEYDRGGRLWRSTAKDGAVRIMFYDANGNATLTLAPPARRCRRAELRPAKRSIAATGRSGGTNIAGAVTTIGRLDKRGQQTRRSSPTGSSAPRSPGRRRRSPSSRTYNAFGETTSGDRRATPRPPISSTTRWAA